MFLILQNQRQEIHAKGEGEENRPSTGQERGKKYVASRTLFSVVENYISGLPLSLLP